jgi:hypothetical protein
MKKATIILFLAITFFTPRLLFAQEARENDSAQLEETPPPAPILSPMHAGVLSYGTGLVSAAHLSYADPQTAILRSKILTAHVRGDLGEAIAAENVVKQTLRETGNWHAITPRFGRQGFDHLFIQYDENGVPRDLIVGETKFGNSRLGETLDGKQMGKEWISERLKGTSLRYLRIADGMKQGTIRSAPVPQKLPEAKIMRIPLDNQTSVPFWQDAEGKWNFAGDKQLFEKAELRLRRDAKFLQDARDGKIDYRSRLYSVKLAENNTAFDVTVRELDANGNFVGEPRKLPRLKVSVARGATIDAITENVAKGLPGLGKSEIRAIAQKINGDLNELLTRKSFSNWGLKTSLSGTASGALLAGVIDLGFQAVDGGQVDWVRTAKTAALGAGAGAAAHGAGILAAKVLTQTTGGVIARQMATSLGVGAGALRSFASSAAGGGIASIVFAYGGYVLGLYDITTANRNALAGGIGAGAGALLGVGVMSGIAAWGITGTGVAISTLSGAAATNASLAILGGGTVAAGGGGMALGAAVLTGGTVVVVLAVSAAVMYGFHLYDTAEEDNRIRGTIEYFKGLSGPFSRKKELEEALRTTNEDLDKLRDEGISKYKFDPTQDNVQEFEEINLYVTVSDEDLKKMEEARKKQAAETW